MSKTIGILGGMGPLATVDFMNKIIAETPARRDQEHIPLLIHSVPQIPDRTASLMEQKASPLTALEKGLNTLIQAGVGCIVIPCNTAHNWYDELLKKSSVPILHIADACIEEIKKEQVTSVSLLATDGTHRANFYPSKLSSENIAYSPISSSCQEKVMQGIYKAKSGDIAAGGRLLEEALKEALDNGVEKVTLGCTEIPFALEQINSAYLPYTIDATRALSKACVKWYYHDKPARQVA